MPAVLADLSIEARWIAPMTARGLVLDNHTLVVRDGRILDILPSAEAPGRYAATVFIERPAHLLMPGMIDAHTLAAPPPALHEAQLARSEFVRDGVLTAIAQMLSSGITCFGDRGSFPRETARIAAEQGVRAVVGLPVAEAAENLTDGLRVRDEYTGHPLISTVFAPQAPDKVSDAAFARVATLADELDAGIMVDLHRSADEIAQSLAEYGVRPIERLWQLGLLTPALSAVHMTHATAADVELAQRTGIAISLGSSSSLRSEHRLPPIASFVASGIRLGLGSGGGACRNHDIWSEMRLFALMSATAWEALAVATRGGAAVLGLDGVVGALESGKWADLCCIDLGGLYTQPSSDPLTQLVFCGGRDLVTDVWVAGRQLLSGGELTRLDWPGVAARSNSWYARMNA